MFRRTAIGNYVRRDSRFVTGRRTDFLDFPTSTRDKLSDEFCPNRCPESDRFSRIGRTIRDKYTDSTYSSYVLRLDMSHRRHDTKNQEENV